MQNYCLLKRYDSIWTFIQEIGVCRWLSSDFHDNRMRQELYSWCTDILEKSYFPNSIFLPRKYMSFGKSVNENYFKKLFFVKRLPLIQTFLAMSNLNRSILFKKIFLNMLPYVKYKFVNYSYGTNFAQEVFTRHWNLLNTWVSCHDRTCGKCSEKSGNAASKSKI